MGEVTAIERLLREFLGLPQRRGKTAVTHSVRSRGPAAAGSRLRRDRGITHFRVDPTTIHARLLLEKLGINLNAGAFSELGDAWLEIAMYDKAVEAYEQAIARDPGRFSAYFNRGLANVRLGKMEEALEDFGRAAGIDPEHAASFSNAAAVLAKLGRHEEGLEYARRAVHLEHGNVAALVNLAAILVHLDLAGEALETLDQALAIRPDVAKAWYDRACALAKLGRFDEARLSLAKASGLDASMTARSEKDGDLSSLAPRPDNTVITNGEGNIAPEE
ncbi:MAG: tetratricopeptide repeat protein [Planctomycetota bacterium]